MENKKTGVKILSVDFAAAENIISNNDLTKILDTSDEWISSRTGIKNRRVISGDTTSTDLGIEAAKKVIKRIDFDPEKIDLIIAASSAPEDIYPSVACIIQDGIDAKNAACFDLRAACSGFIYSMNTARAFIEAGIYKTILIVATDATTKYTDWQDRSTCVLFGDGASAMLVTASDNESDFIGIELMSAGNCKDYITLKIQGTNCSLVDEIKTKTQPYIQMKGKEVYKFVMQLVPSKLEELMKSVNLTVDDIDYFIPHQSNQRMIDALAQRLNIDNSKVISNIANYGNMSAASIPTAIREGIDEGKIKLPATIMLSAFGAGMTCANAIIKLDKEV